MTQDDFDAFVDIMDHTVLVKRADVSVEQTEAWFKDLMEYDIDILEEAFRKVRHSKWGFPDISDIVTAADEIKAEGPWIEPKGMEPLGSLEQEES